MDIEIGKYYGCRDGSIVKIKHIERYALRDCEIMAVIVASRTPGENYGFTDIIYKGDGNVRFSQGYAELDIVGETDPGLFADPGLCPGQIWEIGSGSKVRILGWELDGRGCPILVNFEGSVLSYDIHGRFNGSSSEIMRLTRLVRAVSSRDLLIGDEQYIEEPINLKEDAIGGAEEPQTGSPLAKDVYEGNLILYPCAGDGEESDKDECWYKHRKDKGKLPISDIFKQFPNAVEELARVIAYGEEKYETHSWVKIPDFENRAYNSIGRHYLEIMRGRVYDPESACWHLLHLAWNCLAIAEYKIMTPSREHPELFKSPNAEKPPEPSALPATQLWQHVRTKGLYEILAVADDAADTDSPNRRVVYRSIDGGNVWVCLYSEFYDGRFVKYTIDGVL